MVKTLLLLTCGTNACYHVSKVLKEKFPGEFRIVGTDINHRWMIPTSPYLDVFYQCPYSSSTDYYSFILEICREEIVNFILPSFDEDQKMFYGGNPDLKELGVTSLGINESLLDMYSDKVNINKFLKDNNLPVPVIYSKSELTDNQKYFIKPIHGVGSIGAREMNGKELLNNWDKDVLVQECCHDPEVTLECFNFNGRLSSVARVRIASKSGVCTKTRVYHDEYLQSIAHRFSSIAKLPYIFNLQFMKNTKGEMVITDVNLRTAGGMSLSYAAGWDETSALAKIMLSQSEEEIFSTLSTPVNEQYVIRAYTDIVTKKVNKRIAFDLDGTLLDSRKRHALLMHDILCRKGFNISVDGLVAFKADGQNNIAWLQSQGITGELATEINKEWIERIETPEYLRFDELYPQAKENLKLLSKDNTLYLITARNNEASVRNQIFALGISQYFEGIKVVPSGKQASELKTSFLLDKGINFMIGDTEVDFNAAMNANCEFRVCLEGFRSKKFWAEKNVKQYDINEFTDIQYLL